jgi:uncharacterized protein YukE
MKFAPIHWRVKLKIMSAKHHEYYPIEVLEKELIQLEKIEKSWVGQSKSDYPEQYKKLNKRIKHLNEAIDLLKQIDKIVPSN